MLSRRSSCTPSITCSSHSIKIALEMRCGTRAASSPTTNNFKSIPVLPRCCRNSPRSSKKPARLVFKESGRITFVQPDEVHWVEADGNYVRVHAGDGSHYVRETLGSLESQLPAERFMRISRSIIVNLDRVKELQPLFYGDYAVILKDGSRLNMSRSYRDRLEHLVQRPRK